MSAPGYENGIYRLKDGKELLEEEILKKINTKHPRLPSIEVQKVERLSALKSITVEGLRLDKKTTKPPADQKSQAVKSGTDAEAIETKSKITRPLYDSMWRI